MTRILLPLAALALTACHPPRPAAPPAPPTACGAETLGALIGTTRSPAIEAEARRLSGAERIRWIAPDTAVTMDYSESRLNVHIDDKGVVISAKCG